MDRYRQNPSYHIFAKSNTLLSSTPTISHIGHPFIELSQTGSTNTYAMELVHAKLAAHGTVVFTSNQTKGKGQHGKVWNAEAGSNIALSAIVDVSFLSLHQQFRLSMMAALATYDFFTLHAGKGVTIKWPNDIYYNDSKAGGILIETTEKETSEASFRKRWAIIGIGMNINQLEFPAYLRNATSLKKITNTTYSVNTLANELCACLEVRYKQLKSGFDFLDEYNRHLYKKGETVRLKKDNAAFYCTVDGVDVNGDLCVSNAAYDKFSFGEVAWIVS